MEDISIHGSHGFLHVYIYMCVFWIDATVDTNRTCAIM